MKIRFVTFLLVCVFAFGMVGCDNKNNNGVDAEIYSAPVFMNIMQDEDYADKGAAEFTMSMAKNEYESAQIIFRSPKDTTFNAVIENDLTGENGARIFKSNIEIFAQHYINVTEHSYAYAKDGYYPDALVPMDKYLAKRDNKVQKDKNQAIVITVKTAENTPAGNYSGKLKLIVGNRFQMIPINVTVWDFAVPKENHAKTSFNIWVDPFPNDMLLPGELDSTEEMYKAYYEFFLKYKVSTSYLPTYSYSNLEEYVKVIQEYAVRDEVASYNIYTKGELYTGTDHDGWGIDAQYFRETLEAILNACTAEDDLLAKAYVYVASIDEPRTTADYNRVVYVDKIVSDTKTMLADKYEAMGFFADKPNVRESLLNLSHISTQKWQQAYNDSVDTFCPYFSEYDNPEYLYNVTKGEGAESGKWWYGCISPTNPYPNFHTDGDLISARILPWMQKAYNIEGNLYWGVNIYKKWNGVYNTRDVWEDSCTWINPGGQVVSGDGQLVYPGRKYDVYGPIPTLRLTAIRDGNEDFEYLYVLENLIDECNEIYQTSYTLEDVIGEYYTQLFSGTKYNVAPNELAAARECVAQMILALSSDAKALVTTERGDASDGTKRLNILVNDDSEISVNGEKVTEYRTEGSGRRYSLKIDTAEVGSASIEIKGDKTYRIDRFISYGIKAINSFDDINSLSAVRVSKNNASAEDTIVNFNSDAAYLTNGSGSMKVTLKAVQNSQYSRFIDIPVPADYENFSEVKTISFDLIGNGTGVNSYISILDSKSKHEFTSVYVPPVGVNRVTLKVTESSLVDINGIKYIRFGFDAYRSGQDISFFIDNMYVE